MKGTSIAWSSCTPLPKRFRSHGDSQICSTTTIRPRMHCEATIQSLGICTSNHVSGGLRTSDMFILQTPKKNETIERRMHLKKSRDDAVDVLDNNVSPPLTSPWLSSSVSWQVSDISQLFRCQRPDRRRVFPPILSMPKVSFIVASVIFPADVLSPLAPSGVLSVSRPFSLCRLGYFSTILR